MTVTRDEGQMLARWVDYYGSQVGDDSLVVFDDGSVDGSTENLPCTVHRLPGLPPADFNPARSRLVNGVAAGLLASYDAVACTDVDEFLIPDPAVYEGLADYVAAHQETPVMAPVALNVMHYVGVEPPLDPHRPVLGQRKFAKLAPLMCKPAIKRVPAPWGQASHGIRAPYRVDPGLFMVHLKFADRDALARVAEHRHQLVASEGRGAGSSWAVPPEKIVSRLQAIVGDVDPEQVEEFDPHAVDPDTLVVQEGNTYRAPREGQLVAMKRVPLVRVPRRLHGLV